MKTIRNWMSFLCCTALLAGCSDGESTNSNQGNPGGNPQNPQIVDEDDGHYCGDGFCDDDEDDVSCNRDCNQLKPAVCGDGTCASGETKMNCPLDCKAVCGDGRCEDDETAASCAKDCSYNLIAVCHNGLCEFGENDTTSAYYCPDDCEANAPRPDPITLSQYNSIHETQPLYFMFDIDKALHPVDYKQDDVSHKDAMNDFLSFPFPSDARTDSFGRPNLHGYPVPKLVVKLIIGDIIDSLVDSVQKERRGFSPLGAVYFRSSAPIDQSAWNIDFRQTTSESSCVQLINVEPTSKHYKERVPVYVSFQSVGNDLWADNTLVLRPVPGAGPHPGDRHLAVVMDCMTSNGQHFGQSEKLKSILDGTAPFEEIRKYTKFYVDQIAELNLDVNRIHAFAGYQTMDVAKEMDQIAADLKGKGKIVTDSNGVAIGQWSSFSGYSVFSGTFETVGYIEGNYSSSHPNYSVNGGGVINFDTNGKLVSKGQKEIVNYKITVPNSAMPANGYPIAVYGHGTGGGADTHIYSNDEGGVLLTNGVPMAMIGFDACLQGNRTDGDGTEAELMGMLLKNPIVIRESVRQTVTDMLVLYDIIDNKKLILPPNPNGVDKTSNVIFDPSYGLFMGHSQGSQEAGLLLGLTNSIKNAFISAGGGGVALSFVELKPLSFGVQGIDDLTIADIVSAAFLQKPGSISYDTFLTSHIVQPLLDPIDPLNFAHRFIKEPPAGMAPKNIAQTMGLNDQCTPMVTQMALASAIGLPVVGNLYTASDAMICKGFDTPVNPPVSQNVSSLDGDIVTGGYMQFNYTGTSNPHFVIYRMSAAKQAYIDFFKSALDGNTTVSVNTAKQEGMN